MGHVSIAGQATKRGLIPRLPNGERLLEDVETWLREEHGDLLIGARRRAGPEGSLLRARLHPAASDLVVSADPTGRLALSGRTEGIGPGYHRLLGRIAERLGAELGIAWDLDPPYPWSDRATVERIELASLGATLAEAREARGRARGPVHLGTPPGVRFAADAALVTGLGPRDDAWLERALGDARIALEVLPWWADAMDARYLLNRAVCLMWTEVRWRPPGTDEERAFLDDLLRTLARAYPLDPALPYPWGAWCELLDLRGVDDAGTRFVRERAAAAPARHAPIGYRRAPVTVVHEGWQLEVPGSFAERRGDEDWWGGEGGRSVTVAAVETGVDGRPMTAAEFLDRVAAHLGPDALTHRSGEVEGRARLTTDPSSGLEVGVLDAFSAVGGRGAAIRVVFDDPADWQWAMGVWQGLEPVAPSIGREMAAIAC